MTPSTRRAIERAKLLQSAARRRASYEQWREHYQRIASTPTYGDPEQEIGKHQALELLEQARPG